MKKLKLFICFCLVTVCMAGCGRAVPEETAQVSSSEVPGVETGSKIGVEQTKVYQSVPRQQQEATKPQKVQASKAGESDSDNQIVTESSEISEAEDSEDAEISEEPRELTEQELKKLQWSVRGSDNGFFVSHYSRPEEIEWQKVFAGGAGLGITLSDAQVDIVRENLRQARIEEMERKAELMGIEPVEYEDGEQPQEEPYGEEELALNASKITALTNRSVSNFVKSRTGLDYSEARHPLEWTALDRNIIYDIPAEKETIRVEFMSATVCDNVYEIYYRRAVWAREKKPEYVMKVYYEKGKWNFISNLPLDQTEPITMADIDYVSSKELARLQGAVELIEVPELPEEETYEEVADTKKKKTSKEPVTAWAVITALQDDSVISVERVYDGDGVAQELQKERIYIPGESIATYTLQAGEKLGLKVTLTDAPKVCIRIRSNGYYGEYAFGSENWLKRNTKEGFPLSTYVIGRNADGEHRGTDYTSEKELMKLLNGTWLFYDGAMGEYTAIVRFTQQGGLTIETYGEEYRMEIYGYDRLYTDSRNDPPDVIRVRSTDEETLEKLTKYYPFMVKKVGDYRIRAVQKDGVQLLCLSFENKGKDGLSYLLPGADPLADEIVLYRFDGATSEDGAEGKG
ncbi:MAG: hypothetical protein K5678_13465 [Acetatifactor sp.]|nr:hypothetical protein [Acetatifactor sp.]